MSNTYIIHTEMKLDDAWRCIDGLYMHKPYGKDKEELTLFSTYENGSRSSFGSTYDELRYIGRETKFSDLSKEVQEAHPSLKYKTNWYGKDTKEEACWLTVPLDDFNNHIPRGYSKHGVIHKDHIADYESGEIDELYEDDNIDFSKLSDLEKQCYQYYEWDYKWSWQYWFKILKDKVDHTVNKYYNNEWLIDSHEVRLVVFCL